MSILLRFGFLAIVVLLGTVLITWVALAFLPAFVLFGERGVDWVIGVGDRIAGVPLGSFDKAGEIA